MLTDNKLWITIWKNYRSLSIRTKRIFRSTILTRSYKALEEILAYVSLYGITAKIKPKEKLIDFNPSLKIVCKTTVFPWKLLDKIKVNWETHTITTKQQKS